MTYETFENAITRSADAEQYVQAQSVYVTDEQVGATDGRNLGVPLPNPESNPDSGLDRGISSRGIS